MSYADRDFEDYDSMPGWVWALIIAGVCAIVGLPFLALGAEVTATTDAEAGARLWRALLWCGDHPALLGVFVALATPLVSMIPVVGAPAAMVLAKLGITLIPALQQIAEAVERDHAPTKRAVGETAATIVGQLADDPKSLVGRIPGSATLAGVAAHALVRRMRSKSRGAK